ncbi:MAG: flagellar FlbD family protein [Actinobacteria bacterium]|nr:flagellar FlbD family protein [Actinomycetota bacterium]
MICLHRIRGDELWINPDLIVFAEQTAHDTVVTLADDNRVSVCEPVQEIASAVMQFRASVLAAAENLATIFTHAQRSATGVRHHGSV